MNHLRISMAGFADQGGPAGEPARELAGKLALALGDSESFFADRLNRQRNGRGVLFVGRLGATIVGTVYLWLEAAEEPEIRQFLPSVPLLTHLKVVPGFRNHGFGTRLVAAVEHHVRELGLPKVALAVEENNKDALRLYRRLGYREWPHGFVECDKDVSLLGGDAHREKCVILTKSIGSAVPGR